MKRIALVTGALGGIGTAICQALAGDGMTVVANCLPGDPGKDAWLAAQRAVGHDFGIVEGDVADDASAGAMASAVTARYGAVDVLVNNAGITRDRSLARMDPDAWHAVIATNLGSLYNVTRHLVPAMADRGWGRIVNIASVNGVRGQAGQTNYAAAKAGCLGFTKSLAQEVAPRGVTVNAVAPGYIATAMTAAMRTDVLQTLLDDVPVRRAGRPEDVAAAVAFLCSAAAGYITGSTLHVNGGLHMA